MSDTKISDTKPKRAAREPVQSAVPHSSVTQNPATPSPASLGEAIVAEAVASVTAPVVARIEGRAVPEPEPVSTIALAQAAPAGPACPVPAAPQPSSTANPAASDKSPQAAAETAWTAFAEAQCALARGFEKAAVEMTGISRSGIAATADAAVALLGARTFAEALEINAALARRGFDTLFEASARLSEIGTKTVADASRPMLSRCGRGWDALGTS